MIVMMMIAYVAWGRGSSIAGLVNFGGGWVASLGGGDILSAVKILWKLTQNIKMVI